MYKKILVSFLIILSLSFAIVGCAKAETVPLTTAPPAQVYHLKFAQPVYPKESAHFESITRLADAITKATDGRFTFELYGPEIGDCTEVDEMVMRSTIEMELNCMRPSYEPKWNIIYTPYLAVTYDEMLEFYGPDGFMNDIFTELAVSTSMKWLGTWIQGLSGVSLKTRPASTPEEAKGIKIRVPDCAGMPLYWRALGFETVSIPYAEIPTAISTGLVDGQAGGGTFQAWSCARDINKYWVWYRDYSETWGYTMNIDLWNKLSPADQQIILSEVAKEVVLRGSGEEEDKKYADILEKEYGWTIVDLADYPEKLAKATSLARETWPELEKIIGSKLMGIIRENVK